MPNLANYRLPTVFFIFRKTGEKMALAGRQNQLPPLIASVL
jgi:hypothetical protein